MPFIIKNHSGEALSARLDRFIKAMKRDHQPFATFKTFVDQQRKNND
jgi:putative polysaccharide deacetylase